MPHSASQIRQKVTCSSTTGANATVIRKSDPPLEGVTDAIGSPSPRAHAPSAPRRLSLDPPAVAAVLPLQLQPRRLGPAGDRQLARPGDPGPLDLQLGRDLRPLHS